LTPVSPLARPGEYGGVGVGGGGSLHENAITTTNNAATTNGRALFMSYVFTVSDRKDNATFRTILSFCHTRRRQCHKKMPTLHLKPFGTPIVNTSHGKINKHKQ
jgi:hypothetical protein